MAQLLAEGVGRGAIEHRVKVRRLHRVHRGVYSPLPPRLLRIEGHRMAAVLASGPGAVLSHAAAAAHWELRRSSATLIDVTVPGHGGRRRRRGIRLHRSCTLDESQVTVHDGIPITTVARTLIDLADGHDTRTTERAIDQAEVLRLFDLTEVEAAIEANPGRRGAAVMQRVLEAYRVGVGLTESDLEDEFFRLCDRFGIPRPEAQVPLGPSAPTSSGANSASRSRPTAGAGTAAPTAGRTTAGETCT